MASLRYSYMEMGGNRDGTSRMGTDEVLGAFRVAPTRMTMQMIMPGVMMAPSDRLTLMFMVPYTVLEMDHVTRMGGRFTTKSEGVGDLKLTGLYKLYAQGAHHLHANLGLSLPTGSIDERDQTPGGRVRLPYPMQLGSGTWDLLPGITYAGLGDGWSWGGQAQATIRPGRNNNGYALGNRIRATGWAARRWSESVSTSLRVDGQSWGNVRGRDADLDPTLVPTADPALRGGSRLDVLAGLNVYVRSGPLRGHRIAVEAGLPVWQDLNGPQLETDWLATAGWQYAW